MPPLECYEHDLTIFGKCLSVCNTNFVAALTQKLIYRISLNFIFSCTKAKLDSWLDFGSYHSTGSSDVPIFSSLSYYGMENFDNRAKFRLPVLADLHVLGPKELKKHKISMVSGCLLASMFVSLLVCGDDIFWTNCRMFWF